jgi:hypothetical protein
VTRETAAGAAYLDLQNQARRAKRPTDEAHQLYALEGFLSRLSESPYVDTLVLKGGFLMTAFDARRPTRDVDLEALAFSNDVSDVVDLVRGILEVTPKEDDGLLFDLSTIKGGVIRDGDEYTGVRVDVVAHLATAIIRFHIDVNVGDPIWPSPSPVKVPRLRGGPPIELIGYPLPMVYAEKIVTAVQRGIGNTRWRDFADIWTLIQHHSVEGTLTQRACQVVADHRNVELMPLSIALNGFADLAQNQWKLWLRRQIFGNLPQRFDEVLESVVSFADPILANEVGHLVWEPESGAWISVE